MLKYSGYNYLSCNFANKKTMEKEQIQAILENASDEFLERFYETLLNEINSDDEAYYK